MSYGRTLNHGIRLAGDDYTELVGEYVRRGECSHVVYPDQAAGITEYTYLPFDESETIMTMQQAKDACPVPLTYVEELVLNDRNRAFAERASEGEHHLDILQHSIHSLRRLGYRVYPGGVGVPGVTEMADFLALDGNDVLLVEALTPSSIKKHNAHLKKLRLIGTGLPVCIIGEGLPDDFIRSLPGTAFSLRDPRCAFTYQYEVTRFYWADPQTPPTFVLERKRSGRKKEIFRISIEGIRLQQDASDFWVSAIKEAYLVAKKCGSLDLLAPVFRAPKKHIFPGYLPGKWNIERATCYSFEGEGAFVGAGVTLRLGVEPLEAALTGPDALNALVSCLRNLKIKVEVR